MGRPQVPMITLNPLFCRVAGHVWRGDIPERTLPTIENNDRTYIVHTRCLRCGRYFKTQLHSASRVASTIEDTHGDTTL